MVIFPCAKINIGLYVTDRRDDGFHNIETLFYPIGFSDVLEIVAAPGRNQGAIEVGFSGIKIDGVAGSNLIVKAYHLINKKVGSIPAVDAYLHKCIPTSAGLGGGSSDGAAMLVALNELFGLNLSECDLSGLALELGSDCPYFICPEPSFARGRGEVLTPSTVSLQGKHLLLFHPGTGISTARAYSHVTPGKPDLSIEHSTQLPLPEWRNTVRNAFEPYAISQLPVVGHIIGELYKSGAVYASMTGSGSAVYGIFNEKPEIPTGISGSFIWRESF